MLFRSDVCMCTCFFCILILQKFLNHTHVILFFAKSVRFVHAEYGATGTTSSSIAKPHPGEGGQRDHGGLDAEV